LDEPTNDLDFDGLDRLERFLEQLAVGVVIVSHDRAFLERTVEDILILDGHGQAASAPSYAAYEAVRARSALPSFPVANTRPDAGARHTVSDSRADGTTARLRSPTTVRRLLASAERDMVAAADQRDRLAAELAAAGGDHLQLASTGNALAAAEEKVATTEQRWLELAEELGA
ncbi:MAG: hypothetical protein DLM54_06410, partial [Acidimicrobiales bacterium]